jgi:hypothetical protein
MPLFFIIAIAAGGLTVGATAVDVTQDIRAQQQQGQSGYQAPPAQQGQAVVMFNPASYATLADCQAAAQRMSVPLSACAGKM